MAREPLFGPALDTLDAGRLKDPALAGIALLRQVDLRQHALMTGWGWPPCAYTFYLAATGATSQVLSVRVPPGVTDLDLSLLMAGFGTVVVTSAVDAVGTQLQCLNGTNAVAAGADAELGEWFETGGPMPSSYGATSGRAVTVASSASWGPQDVDLTFTVSNVTTAFTILGVVVRPCHVPR